MMPNAATEADVKIQIERISVSYGDALVLDDIDLSVKTSEILCIVGASGCGKSTLLNVVAGLIPYQSGRICVDDRYIQHPGADRVMVFQDDAVFPWMRVRDNVAYGLRVKRLGSVEIRSRVSEILDLVELSDHANVFPKQLSGGMRKRVDLARALAVRPEVLLMDEPYAALDAMTKERLQVHFLNICEQTRTTALFVTHDLEEALFLGDRVAVLGGRPGRVSDMLDVPFPHPRDVSIKRTAAFQELRGALTAGIN